jgi:Protein of unknown function (DUF3761)
MKPLAVIGLMAAIFIAPPTESYSRGSHDHDGDHGFRVDRTDYNQRDVSAHCKDRTLSHSHHYRGACYGHGGVAHWW